MSKRKSRTTIHESANCKLQKIEPLTALWQCSLKEWYTKTCADEKEALQGFVAVC